MTGRGRSWRQPMTITAKSPMTARSRHITRISGEMKNCATSRAARTMPSRRTECSWRMTISWSVVNRKGGITSTVTDTWPKASDVTMAAE